MRALASSLRAEWGGALPPPTSLPSLLRLRGPAQQRRYQLVVAAYSLGEDMVELYTGAQEGPATELRRRATINGAAFGFAFRVGDTVSRPFLSADDLSIRSRIESGDFDLVLYSATGTYPFLDQVKANANRTKLAFLQFLDRHDDPHQRTMQACAHGPVFIREMTDHKC